MAHSSVNFFITEDVPPIPKKRGYPANNALLYLENHVINIYSNYILGGKQVNRDNCARIARPHECQFSSVFNQLHKESLRISASCNCLIKNYTITPVPVFRKSLKCASRVSL